MQPLKTYLTKDGWKKELDETLEDASKAYRWIVGETPEETKAKSMVKPMEKILGHIGFPKGIVHGLDKLVNYCDKNNIAIVPVCLPKEDLQILKTYWNKTGIEVPKISEGDSYIVGVKLGKGAYELNYDRNGHYKGMNAEFNVAVPPGCSHLPM